jgi:serine/threonine protein phosphatase PrpC
LYGYLTANEIAEFMQLGPEAATRRLVDLANERGGGDNITSVAVQLLQTP